MSKTVLAQVDGFTPIIDALVEDVGIIAAAVFGRMWRYCQMENGVCHASLGTIADELHLSVRTVIRHSDNLVSKGYLKDTTPDLRNVPHTYADTGKAGISISVVGMTKSHSGYDKKSQPGMTKSHLKKEYKKEDKTQGAEKAPRPRDLLFDAIAEVCRVDPATAGSSIAKVESALKKSTPPYTPEEVREFGVKWWEWKERTEPPSIWKLKEQIGTVRNGNGTHMAEQDQPKPRKVYR